MSAHAVENWNADFRAAVVRELPRLDFSQTFAHSIHEQAVRKPASDAVRFHATGHAVSGGVAWDKFIAGAEVDE